MSTTRFPTNKNVWLCALYLPCITFPPNISCKYTEVNPQFNLGNNFSASATNLFPSISGLYLVYRQESRSFGTLFSSNSTRTLSTIVWIFETLFTMALFILLATAERTRVVSPDLGFLRNRPSFLFSTDFDKPSLFDRCWSAFQCCQSFQVKTNDE